MSRWRTQAEAFLFFSGGHLMKGQGAVALAQSQLTAIGTEVTPPGNGEGRLEDNLGAFPIPEQKVRGLARDVLPIANGQEVAVRTEEYICSYRHAVAGELARQVGQ